MLAILFLIDSSLHILQRQLRTILIQQNVVFKQRTLLVQGLNQIVNSPKLNVISSVDLLPIFTTRNTFNRLLRHRIAFIVKNHHRLITKNCIEVRPLQMTNDILFDPFPSARQKLETLMPIILDQLLELLRNIAINYILLPQLLIFIDSHLLQKL